MHNISHPINKTQFPTSTLRQSCCFLTRSVQWLSMLRYSIDEGRFLSQDIPAAFRFLEKGKVVLNFNQLKNNLSIHSHAAYFGSDVEQARTETIKNLL